MHRIVTSTDLGETGTRFRVRIESDFCETSSGLEESMKQMILQNLADNPALLMCGVTPFKTLKMFHTGTVWVVEAEAIVERPNAQQPRSNSQA